MKPEQIVQRFEVFLRSHGLKLTAQRRRILDRAFATHEHFSADDLYAWMKTEPGPRVSRATVYRTLALLQEGRFVEGLDAGRGELVYEHVLGHAHHDHLLCLGCGRIEEFHDERIEALQEEAAARKGFVLVSHDLRLRGYCRTCAAKRARGEVAAKSVEKTGGSGVAKRAPADRARRAGSPR
ncbi:MAG: Fur family transcriptional regulator [Planctomycetota bacterium]|nr:Fur family transcriptional regulator [Planctomycetota bacterium]